MKINKDSLKARANNISKELHIDQNVIYGRFFFDAFLSRLSISKYSDKLILKGGLYLSSLLGVVNRNTVDIDFCIKSLKMEKENVLSIVEEIISEKSDDLIEFKVLSVHDIRKEDIYGGFSIELIGKLDNVRQVFMVDIATGDPIIPSEKNYNYTCLVSKETLPIRVYSLESVVAEKLETVLSKQLANSRAKDYYDLFILRITQLQNINIIDLRKAFREACNHRNYSITKEEAIFLMSEIRRNEILNSRWNQYKNKNKYAETVSFNQTIDSILDWINDILWVCQLTLKS